MREGVGGLELQAAPHAVRELTLQPVIYGVELVDLVVGLEQRVIVNRIERQIVEALAWRRAEVQAGTAHGGWSAAKSPIHTWECETVVRIATERHQLRHQIGIGRIAVPLRVYVYAHRPNIGDIDRIVARQLPLDIEGPVVACSIGKMCVENHDALRGCAVGNRRRRRKGGNLSGESAPKGACGVVNCVEIKVGKLRLKRRIGTGIPKGISESAVMEDTKPRPDRGLAVFPGIPAKPNAWLNIFVIRLVERMT